MQEYTHYREADALIKAGQYKQALELLHQSVNLHPTDAHALHDRAVCLFHLKRSKEAMADLNRAVELEPHNAYRFASRGFIRSALKDTKGALADYHRALELDPEDAVTQNNLGLLEEQMGYEKEAKERFAVADELQQIMEESGIAPAGESARAVSHLTPDATVDSAPVNDTLKHMKAVVTRKSAFFEFVAFCRNGFKLPK